MYICRDRKVLLGMGIGIVLTSIFIGVYNNYYRMSDSEIEERARGLGMHYNEECKVLFEEEGLNND